MPRRKSRSRKQKLHITLRQRKITLLLDKVLFFRYLQGLHGRFWGVTALFGMLFGFGVCFLIRPDLLSLSTAFSDFGNDTRTAPYFAGSVFFAAYGLWRWRNYLRRTIRRTRPIMVLLSITIVSLYTIALMPDEWHGLPRRLHHIAVATLGVSIVLTVILDGILSKTKRGKNTREWSIVRFTSFCLIIIGGWITFGSLDAVGYYELSGLGELLMIAGYGQWVIVKTYRGDGGRTTLSRMIHKIITIK